MANELTESNTLIGRVVSNKMQKTITVSIERTVKHQKYGKIMKRRSKIKAHDEKQTCKMGDMVKIRQTRPISKDKSWALVEVLSSL